MFNKLKQIFFLTEEEKQAKKEELEKYKQGLKKQATDYKEFLDERLDNYKKSIEEGYKRNKEEELENILSEIDEYEKDYKEVKSNMYTLPSHYHIYFNGFKSKMAFLKDRIKIYGEIPENISEKTEEWIKELEFLGIICKEKYKQEQIENIRLKSPKVAEKLEANNKNRDFYIDGDIYVYEGNEYNLVPLTKEKALQVKGTNEENMSNGLLGVELPYLYHYGIDEKYLKYSLIQEVLCPDMEENFWLGAIKIELKNIPDDMFDEYLTWRISFFENMKLYQEGLNTYDIDIEEKKERTLYSENISKILDYLKNYE